MRDIFQSHWRKPVTRRALLRGAGGALGAAVIGGSLIGCGSSSNQQEKAVASSTPTASGPKRGGTLVIVSPSQFTDLIPSFVGSGALAARFVYDRLLSYDHFHGRYELMTAQSLEMPDPKTYIFKIKPNARYANLPPVNGRQVTSEDIKLFWEYYISNPRVTNASAFTGIDHYETPDPQTLIVKMKQPNGWSIGPSGFTPHWFLPKELTENIELARTNAIGSGAYVVEKFDPNGSVSFVRRPDGWYVPDRPYIDKAVSIVISDAAAREAAFKAKQIDQLSVRDKLQVDEFKSWGGDMDFDKVFRGPPVVLLRADREGGYFWDPRVREAIYNALDIKQFIDMVELGDGQYVGPVGAYAGQVWELPQDELKKYFPHDLKKANELMTAAGWDKNLEVEIKYISGRKDLVSELLGKQLAAIGIKTKLVPQDENSVFWPVTYGTFDFQIAMRYEMAIQDPDWFLRLHMSDGGGPGNRCRWSDPEIDKLVPTQQVETNPDKQKEIIYEAQRLIMKKFSPLINLYSPIGYDARWSYYHAAYYEMGNPGYQGHYSWLDVDKMPKR